MTAFILVPGTFTGGWIWQEVAAGLRASGAQAHPVTLTGMGDGGPPAAPGTDLETHIQDVVRLIDRIDAAEVVLVGHAYGLYPVLGAAGRRPERITRIVNVDGGLPQDGDPALALVPDQALRDRLLNPSGPDGDDGTAVGDGPDGKDGLIAPPSLDAWQRWGSVEGVGTEGLERLSRRAAPQPAGTLTQPLPLAEVVGELPLTGVLCTANGSSIQLVESVVGFGDPRFQSLTDPRVSFFELATGHWPMLSVPGELAEVLVRAAAGEGQRIGPAAKEQPVHLRPFLMDVPERPRERIGRLDLHLPESLSDGVGDGGGPLPAVVFVHGGPLPAGARPTPRDWPVLVGYGQYVANLGAVGVTLDHGLHDFTDYGRAAQDIADAVTLVRADPRVDGSRVALWYFSGGGLLSADWLAEPPPWLRCVAATYPVLAPLPNWMLVDPRFRPAAAVRGAGRLPIVLTRVGLEQPEIMATVQEFLTAAGECEANIEVVDVPSGHHSFEAVDHTDEAREAVRYAVRTVLGHLRAQGSSAATRTA
ncbi:alpha/beta fold hydrolase [Streptomyces finlayi]|uniref:Alpha/beta fold hydrolase n=1 Tax=Streptomyces finlayi TaxID=67296 RepID=A0A7G7BDP5_9ACTN|nr:alpha/beta fold hydrolase [Streptomyces finlayi]QNE73460.1 alpha/beta fold hydrolase [Streptomyces finlayi]